MAAWEPLLVNGVDVVPFVEAELHRRYPGRGKRYAEDPDEPRVAWEVLQATWSDVLARAAAMPEGTVDIWVAGEWTFSQTLRHLVLATDVWLRRAVLGVEQPVHPIGQLDEGTAAGDGVDLSVFTTDQPTYEEVLRVRAERVAMVRDFLAGVTVEELAVERANPWAPQYPETTRSCLHTILEEGGAPAVRRAGPRPDRGAVAPDLRQASHSHDVARGAGSAAEPDVRRAQKGPRAARPAPRRRRRRPRVSTSRQTWSTTAACGHSSTGSRSAPDRASEASVGLSAPARAAVGDIGELVREQIGAADRRRRLVVQPSRRPR